MQTLHSRRAWRALFLAGATLLVLTGCTNGYGFMDQAAATFVNAVPRTLFNVGLQLVLSILNGTSSFFFQSGGQFGGGFGS
ncbi:MAG: hypothetical protein U1A27_14145 [Phycisphaerae bacterium]